MTEPLADDLDRDALAEQQRGVGVPEILQGDAGEVGLPRGEGTSELACPKGRPGRDDRSRRVERHDLPLSAKASKEARYRVTDPYLQFWLRFIGPSMPEIERGRGDRTLARVRESWTTWRGRALEPVIHESLARLLPIEGLPDATVVGSYWTRSNNPEVDIVAADRSPVAKAIAFTGTITWRENASLDQRDLAKLVADTAKIPGADASTPCVAVSRSGAGVTGAAAVLGPDDLIEAWTSRARSAANP